MSALLFPGISARTVQTSRLRVSVLERRSPTARRTLVLVHGNLSSSLFWQPAMLELPDDVHAIAVDLRGFGDSEDLPVDATRGVRDYADDVWSAIDAIGSLSESGYGVHLVGWSLGGPVVLQQLLDRPAAVASLTLVAPVSPFGLGGTTGETGGLLTDDAAGTGAGAANPGFVAHLTAGDRGAEHRSSPRSAFRSSYVAPGFTPPEGEEDVWVESILSTRTGPERYPGDSVRSPNWPGYAPGTHGPLNAMSPRYLDVSPIDQLPHKPPILWVRGADDVIVSDSSIFDVNALGRAGRIDGWPGESAAPPQPMLAQLRWMLERYRAAGGAYDELLFDGCGHSPHIERTHEFAQALAAHTSSADSAAADDDTRDDDTLT